MVRLAEPLRPLFPYLKSGYTLGTRLAAPATIRLSRLRGGWVPRGIAWTMEDAAADGGRLELARPPELIERPVPVGVPAEHPVFVQARSEQIPRVAVLELADGRVMAPSAMVVTREGRLVQDLCWYFGTKRPREHPLFLHPFPDPPTEVDGRVGVLASRGDVNYYHFLHDCLPRLGVLEQCPRVAPPERWYVPQATRFQRELLDLIGLPAEQRIDSAAVPHLRATQLVAPGLPSDIVRNPPWVSAFLRDRLKGPSLERVPGRHVFITRGKGKHNRSITNEDDVLEVLDRHGFESVDAGELSVAEQIRTFAEADVLVAPHGAALANLAFCSPGATVLELFPATTVVADYWKMASGVPGLEYRYLQGIGAVETSRRGTLVVSDITVDVPQLTAMLDEILASRRRS